MQKANQTNIPEIRELLIKNDLPVADITNNIDFYIEKDNNQIIAVGGLEPAGNNLIMRSIAVSEDYKGKGFGTKITQHLLDTAKKHNLDSVYILTLTAEKYFPKFGFIKIERESAPEAIKNSSEFTTVCPDSAVLMKLEIN